jgi:outer membrane protein W
MRRSLIHSALLLFCCSSLWAADASGNRWRISILASEISAPADNVYWDDTHAGVSVGLAYAPTPQWDVEFTAATQTHTSQYSRLFYSPGLDGAPGVTYPSFEFHRYRVTPFDLSVTRHFRADQVISPYLRAGVRYVQAPDNPAPQTIIIGPFEPGGPYLIPVSEGFNLSDRLSTAAGAGVRVKLTPRTAIRGEVNRLLRSEGADFDPLTRYAVGVSWLF